MHADDTNYTVIKNGVVVVSGTGPAIRVDGNQLVIRDGPQETPPLCLTKAQASRKLHHVVVCGHAGGFVTFDALRWLRDTGVAFSQVDWDGAIIMASGPRGPDRPAFRRAQALVCSGVIPKATVAITREILRVKLNGQAEVARLMRSADVSAEIGRLSARLARETDGSKVLSIEAHAASIYWKLWKDVPVRFARRSPQRLGPNGRWRAGRTDLWLTFGQRASLLTKSPHRATTPGNAVLNYLYALLASEMTVAMLAAGLDPGIGMFHADFDGRSSLALDAIEATRPHVDYWLFGFLEASTFANRDFYRAFRRRGSPDTSAQFASRAHHGAMAKGMSANRRVVSSELLQSSRPWHGDDSRRRQDPCAAYDPAKPIRTRAETRSANGTAAGIHCPGRRLSADAGAGRVY